MDEDFAQESFSSDDGYKENPFTTNYCETEELKYTTPSSLVSIPIIGVSFLAILSYIKETVNSLRLNGREKYIKKREYLDAVGLILFLMVGGMQYNFMINCNGVTGLKYALPSIIGIYVITYIIDIYLKDPDEGKWFKSY